MEVEKINQIKKILADTIKSSDLPDFFYDHLAGMIAEESFPKVQDMYNLIGSILQNGQKVSKDNALSQCGTIIKELISKNLLNENPLSNMQIDRLEKPVKLQSFEIQIDADAQSGFADAFIGNKKIDIFLEQSGGDKGGKTKSSIQKRKEKEEQKKQLVFKSHMEELARITKSLPPTIVIHAKGAGKKKDIIVDSIDLSIGGTVLLEKTKLELVQGKKYGLIGRNGIGKTTLLNAIVRREAHFGKIGTEQQILLVQQEVHGIKSFQIKTETLFYAFSKGDDKSVLETVLECDTERTQLLKELDELSAQNDSKKNGERLIEIQEKLDNIKAYSTPAKASKICSGLGFDHEMQQMKTKHLSGGWRMRVSLAKALFVNPDILLLDEPTNHLDLNAVMWLEEYLQKSKSTVVVVSHAREFLNVVCSDIIHFFNYKLTYYRGNYDSFEKDRSEKLQAQQKQFDAQKIQIEHQQQFIDKFRYNAKRAALVQSRIKALNKLERVEEIMRDPTCIFIFPTPEKLRPPIITMEEGLFGYTEDKILLKNVNFNVDMESRVALVGSNGIGKTTFLNLLTQKLVLLEGSVYSHQRAKIAMFTQHHVDQLDLINSPIEQFEKSFPNQSANSYRGHLSSFGITQDLQIRPMYLLSGGQKSRVALALCVYLNPQILILDEPTNHLDIDAVNAFIVALTSFQGGVLIVSHDQHLIASVCDDLFYIKDQRVKKFNGSFEEYRKALQIGSL